MQEILISYFVYNLILGVVFSSIRLFQEGLKGPFLDRVLLLLLPVIGLGYWRHSQQLQLKSKSLFPRKWFVLKYMIKIHWGYLVLLVLSPILIILVAIGLMALGVASELSYSGLSIMDDFLPVIVAGGWLFGIFGSFIIIVTGIIPYLILIQIPKASKQHIERSLTFNAPTVEETAKPIRKPIAMFPEIEEFVKTCENDFNTIPSERKKELKLVAQYISDKINNSEIVNLVFICTHNSRRSQFGQIWAAVAVAHYGIRNINTFSGGTEETAFNKRAVEAIKRTGLKVEGTVSTNPRYSVKFSDQVGALDCYSKTFDNPANPQKGFAAIMTCSDADENCPIVPGAEFRARITYDDPKVADQTTEETQTYDERSRQIATEMLYLFSKVA